MMNFLKNFFVEEEGASAVEYGVVVALIALLLLVVFASDGPLAGALESLFQTVEDNVAQVDTP